MWTYNNKLVAIAINTNSVQYIQFDDGTQETGKNAIKSFKHGIFVNPTLDKNKYLSLLKVFHPDVSNLDINLATQIAQAIISAKDGTATVINPQKTNYQSQSDTKAKASTSSNYYSWWQQSTRSDSDTSERQNTQRQRSGHHQQPKQSREKKDFETWLSYVPTNYWKIFGHSDTFERDRSVDFRIFKRCYYGYFDTELEIVFRHQCIYREKVTAIHRNSLHILHQLNLNSLTKNDLWTLCNYEAIPYNQFERKTELVDNIFRHHCNSRDEHEPTQDYWSIILTSPRPLWKHKFIKSNYHNNFEQFNYGSNSRKQSSKTHESKSKHDDTFDYLNCGQYLKLKNQWLERDEFLYFLQLTRNLAQELNIKTNDSDGYPGYPLQVLDLAWQKISI